MDTRSKKAKGRRLQNWVRDKLLSAFPSLTTDDISGAIMGETGVDIKFSTRAKELIPYSIECKNKETFKGIYDIMVQANHHIKENETAIAVIKMNQREPLMIVDAEHFINLIKEKNAEKK
jgi:hypothetical protein|tara:strand:+ start:2209 stop:2568 length:360 start_codon:yes stop_codon:yes gene_type:complete